jgi:hypothetical protein
MTGRVAAYLNPNLNSHGQKLCLLKAARPLLFVSYIRVSRTVTVSLSIFNQSLSHYPWPIQAVTLLAPALMIRLRPYYGQRNRKSIAPLGCTLSNIASLDLIV